MVESLKKIFQRDLEKLKLEIELYTNEENIWKTDKQISNSAGNLCLHIIGNLNTYIGAEIGKTGYMRNREFEFEGKDVPKNELTEKIDQTIFTIDTSLDILSDDHLKEDYPLLVLKEKTSYGFFLIHLSCHLNYHLGQVNYHRRLLDAD